jgi:hypothetical protein
MVPYKKLGINCNIIQDYVFKKTIPIEDYIIIDEIGFLDTASHDVLYKCNYAQKTIEALGDFEQIEPPDNSATCSQPHYLEYLFKEIYTPDKTKTEAPYIYQKFVNWRNNFPQSYYDELINSDKPGWLKNEIKYHSTDYRTAEVIVCYLHETRQKYNRKMLKYHNLWKGSFELSYVPGAKIICMDNNYFIKKTDKKIHNRQNFEILAKNYHSEEEINLYTLIDRSNDFTVVVNEKQLLKNFQFAYAINLHQVQGDTIESYHWVDDVKDNKFINEARGGRLAYTLISRLKRILIRDVIKFFVHYVQGTNDDDEHDACLEDANKAFEKFKMCKTIEEQRQVLKPFGWSKKC